MLYEVITPGKGSCERFLPQLRQMRKLQMDMGIDERGGQGCLRVIHHIGLGEPLQQRRKGIDGQYSVLLDGNASSSKGRPLNRDNPRRGMDLQGRHQIGV